MRPISIVGAGPVGLTAALALARRGIPVTVLEAGPTLSAQSRASTFHPPTLEMLADLGVADALHERGLRAPVFQYRDRTEGMVANLDLGLLADDTPYPYRLQCEQSKLTPLLLDALGRLPGTDMRFDHRVTGVTPVPGGVHVHLADGARVSADWLIAADGAHSAVRHSLRLPFEGRTYPERFLVVSVDEDLTAALPDLACVTYVMDPVEWLVLLRTPDHWRVLVPLPGTTDHPRGRPDPDAAWVRERLRGVADLGREWRVVDTGVYPVHQRVASRFRADRVLFAGDAAHVNNPLGGLGMNSGIHDAIALTSALTRLLDGEPETVLDRAAERRRIIATRFVGESAHRNRERLRTTDPLRRAEHHAELRALAADPERARAHLLHTSMIASLRESA
ncbi:FAD-binding monooxygenase [Embleya scabrispora]|uniref:FAD-binding monooxygenase n=1 Tax=Embleya scabrispora TaxID=159449 RepID=A0A1T3NSS2_9ACTN|nr:NAD(P)/FAD-dependent oxidoreductase [Embleya scabrispora]OPC79671.1 FAD-binding monooxygenase [Embleya scabrispora]